MALRPIAPEDQPLLWEIYADAIESQAPLLYSEEQVRAWAALAWLPGVLDASFQEGTAMALPRGTTTAVEQRKTIFRIANRKGRTIRGEPSRALPKTRIEHAGQPGQSRPGPDLFI